MVDFYLELKKPIGLNDDDQLDLSSEIYGKI